MDTIVCINYMAAQSVLECLDIFATRAVFISAETSRDYYVDRFRVLLFLFHLPAPWDHAHIELLWALKRKYASIPFIITSDEYNAVAQLKVFRSVNVVDFIVIPNEITHLANVADSIIGSTEPKKKRPNHERGLKKAVDYVAHHYASKISVRDVARHCATSTDTLYRWFKREYKCSFREYVKTYRLHAATRLLLESNLSIVQVAYLSGYENVSLFNRLFKLRHACCPSEFRGKNMHTQ